VLPAFDTVDHDILLDVLRRRFLVAEPTLQWIHSCLNDWTQIITVDGKESASIPVTYSVPRGPVLGLIQFISYSENAAIVFYAHQSSPSLAVSVNALKHFFFDNHFLILYCDSTTHLWTS